MMILFLSFLLSLAYSQPSTTSDGNVTIVTDITPSPTNPGQYLPDCECITGWTHSDIDCTTGVEDNTIKILETFLELENINCIDTCSSNYDCQQSLSLLTQYYDKCERGIINEMLIHKYWDESSCNDCKMRPLYESDDLEMCETGIDCSDIIKENEIQASIVYIVNNCSDIDINPLATTTTTTTSQPIISTNGGDTSTSTPSPDSSGTTEAAQTTITVQTPSPIEHECTDECSSNWYDIASYSRTCRNSLGSAYYLALNALYDNEYMSCVNDCWYEIDYNHTGYPYDCNNTLNYELTQETQLNGILDINNIKDQIWLCFYGLNVNDPTDLDLICFERATLNESGVEDYTAVPSDDNTKYWGMFGFGNDLDQLWVLLCGTLVFFMQLGFTLIEAGSVKAGNVQNILFKNMMDACIGSVLFFMFGYCVAYGDSTSPDANGFMGVENILIESEDWNSWFFQWAFAATAATIVSGAVAERCTIESYFIYTIAISSWIYPVVVHWVWSDKGWISPFNSDPGPSVYAGAIDFAGSAVVHMVGGFCGLCGAYWLGPRFRRFDHSPEAQKSEFYIELQHQFEYGHNVPFQVIGGLMLWFGWYGFNCGSTLAANGAMELASKVAVTTTLAAATGGMTCAFLARFVQKKWHIPRVINGILAALVSITASCATSEPGWSILIGFIGGLVYYGASNLMEYVEIDDPLDAFAVHGCGGMWGVLSAGLFATSETVAFAGYSDEMIAASVGERFATSLTLVITVACWTILNAGLLFGVLNYLGILRVTNDMERSGIDVHEHGGSALNMGKTYRKSHKRERGDKKNKKNTFKDKKHKKQHRHINDDNDNDNNNNNNTVQNDGNFGNMNDQSLSDKLEKIHDENESLFPN